MHQYYKQRQRKNEHHHDRHNSPLSCIFASAQQPISYLSTSDQGLFPPSRHRDAERHDKGDAQSDPQSRKTICCGKPIRLRPMSMIKAATSTCTSPAYTCACGILIVSAVARTMREEKRTRKIPRTSVHNAVKTWETYPRRPAPKLFNGSITSSF